MEATVKLHSYNYSDYHTYMYAAIFIAGNILFPQLAHLMPQGGLIWMPIYFFTLVGAYKYGWRIGLLTAIFSPFVNHLLFGMPSAAVLPAILLKSTLLAFIASAVARHSGAVSLLSMLLVVAGYQFAGTLGEMLILPVWTDAFQDLCIGWPGMLFQVAGGYALLKAMK